MKPFSAAIVATLISCAAGTAIAQQQPGQVGSGAPEDVVLEVAVANDGLTLSQGEIRLALGGYYRFNLVCPQDLGNEAGINFTAPEFLQNTHLRLISVGDLDGDNEINFHVQGLNFRAIDCEGMQASARFSFHPMRRGSFLFTVKADLDPPREAVGTFVVE